MSGLLISEVFGLTIVLLNLDRRATRTYRVDHCYFKLLITSPWIWMNIVTCYILLSECLFVGWFQFWQISTAYTSSWILLRSLEVVLVTGHLCLVLFLAMTSPWEALKKCKRLEWWCRTCGATGGGIFVGRKRAVLRLILFGIVKKMFQIYNYNMTICILDHFDIVVLSFCFLLRKVIVYV